MESRSFYNEILTEHNLRPEYKHDLPDANIVLEGVNPNCGDDIFLKLKVENGVIEDGAFVGDGCAISQASADIMLGMIVGKTKEEALKLGDLFLRMIQVINGSCQPCCTGSIHRSGLKFIRQFRKNCPFSCYRIYHFAAGEKWRHFFKQRFLAI